MFDIADNERTLADLRRQLEGPGVVPFVGAGFSVPCGLPEWSRFLRELAGSRDTVLELGLLGTRGAAEGGSRWPSVES